ncbi:hypothetical protein GIB67_040705 [Kingdonia uniflora]|uniref:Pentatricopeptide repeat-containing protein n=1 Tax=Kingdonia uniflora TaxID=39325 RepID=A0A7J7KUB3_9MAGN|nr:hypothetical protein GIB67_040705 [Kingdonia uniflora]
MRNSLIDFYIACCETDKSRRVFNESPQCRDIVTWNVILASYARDERIDVMEDLFEEMPEKDVIWWSTMIETACAQLGLLKQGQFVHSSMNSVKFPMSVSIGVGVIDMHAKCGCIEMSKKVFSEMPRRDVWAWNAMISGLAMHNFGKEAVSLLKGWWGVMIREFDGTAIKGAAGSFDSKSITILELKAVEMGLVLADKINRKKALLETNGAADYLAGLHVGADWVEFTLSSFAQDLKDIIHRESMGSFDGILDLLARAYRSLPEAMMIMIPEE